MINGKDIYEILTAIVPLYVTMILAYGSVRWWKILTPDQCAGISRFVAVFAVPLLSFRFISSTNIYAMSSNYLFLAADCLQKVTILFLLLLWLVIFKRGGIEWTITLFALSTLPNTLIMGIPLLNAMYGEFTTALMIQVVVLQGVIWYTVLLILYEYRGATLLIAEKFPETGGAISSFEVDLDVASLSNHKSLQADAEIGEDGKLHVKLKRSTSASSSNISSFHKSHELNSLVSFIPRVSDISSAEIFSVQSSRWSNVNQTDFQAMMAYNGKVPTPRSSNVEEAETLRISKRSAIVPSYPPPNPAGSTRRKERGGVAGVTPNNNNELHMFVWSSSVSDGNSLQGQLVHGKSASIDLAQEKSSRLTLNQDTEASGGQQDKERQGAKRQQMPPASVMARLILIMVWRKVTGNPNTYASILGLSWALISFKYHVQLPSIVAKSISLLSDTGLGMAMFSLGLFMALQPKIIACGKSLALLGMVVRFFVGPAVMGATSAAFGIRGNLLRVAIIQAALPEAIVPFVFAKEYDVHPPMLSTAVIFGMLVALPITILYFVILELIH